MLKEKVGKVPAPTKLGNMTAQYFQSTKSFDLSTSTVAPSDSVYSTSNEPAVSMSGYLDSSQIRDMEAIQQEY
jgi:hypothetical protein